MSKPMETARGTSASDPDAMQEPAQPDASTPDIDPAVQRYIDDQMERLFRRRMDRRWLRFEHMYDRLAALVPDGATATSHEPPAPDDHTAPDDPATEPAPPASSTDGAADAALQPGPAGVVTVADEHDPALSEARAHLESGQGGVNVATDADDPALAEVRQLLNGLARLLAAAPTERDASLHEQRAAGPASLVTPGGGAARQDLRAAYERRKRALRPGDLSALMALKREFRGKGMDIF